MDAQLSGNLSGLHFGYQSRFIDAHNAIKHYIVTGMVMIPKTELITVINALKNTKTKPMLRFCTLFDKNYISKGMALYESLCETIKDEFEIHILAIDQETIDFLTNKTWGSNNVFVYSLFELEAEHEDLRNAKDIPATLYGSQRDNYIWCLTPWFTNYVLKSIPEGEHVIYVDSDLYFYKSPQFILNAMGDRSFGIHSHRFSISFEQYLSKDNENTGFFNVGCVVFKNNHIGMEISEKWKQMCLTNTQRPITNRFAACGDQGWLVPLYLEYKPETCVFDWAGLSHMAPWTVWPTEYKSNDMVVYNGKEEPLMFFHFSHFNYDLKTDTWRDAHSKEWNPSAIPEVAAYYQRYFNSIKQVHQKYNIV